MATLALTGVQSPLPVLTRIFSPVASFSPFATVSLMGGIDPSWPNPVSIRPIAPLPTNGTGGGSGTVGYASC
jgi:hypothetical protein